MLKAKLKQFFLLKTGVKFHFKRRRLNAAKGQDRLQLGYGHIGHADVACKPFVHQFFHLTPGAHETVDGKRLGVRVTGVNGAARCMVIGKRPVDKINIKLFQL